jgi:hypothetical protein
MWHYSLMSTKTYMEMPDEKTKWTKKREKNTVRPAGLETRRSFSYTIITKNPVFWLCCCSLNNLKCIVGD